jgi:magnesium-transporting ATPase (P-type)
MDIDDETHSYKPHGSPAEVGMINFLISSGLPVQDLLLHKERLYPLVLIIPFCPIRKRMIVAYKISDCLVRLVAKGAPEEIVPRCSF